MAQFSYQDLLHTGLGHCVTFHQEFDRARLWTDSRTLQPGDFFIPLSGENFDGHYYLEAAFQKGAVGAFIQSKQLETHPEWNTLPNLIGTHCPLSAYLSMAQLHRERTNPLVLAVTGSSGKTTTKEMLYAALHPLKKTQKTLKNFNNEIGVAQTLLQTSPETEVLIVEMGMRGRGEIEILSKAAKPDIAIINNVGTAHIGRLGSRENIIQAKLEIIAGLCPETGTLVINTDNRALLDAAKTVWNGRLLTYNTEDAVILSAFDGEKTVFQHNSFPDCPITLAVPGIHMVSNALGVLTVGQHMGLSPSKLTLGLQTYQPDANRGNQKKLEGFSDCSILNDAYNANPDSMKASITAFLESENLLHKRKILVLGGMKELGNYTKKAHQNIGEWLTTLSSIDYLFTVGEEAEEIARSANSSQLHVKHFSTVQQLGTFLASKENLLDNSIVYLKGSRVYQLDQLSAILEHAKVTTP